MLEFRSGMVTPLAVGISYPSSVFKTHHRKRLISFYYLVFLPIQAKILLLRGLS
jgi:hypothetical protein